MADRYLVATGNWNSTAVWSATSGGAGGASVPTTGDDVFIWSLSTVTLTGDVAIKSLSMNSVNTGRVFLNGYKLSITTGGQGLSQGELDLTNSILQVDRGSGTYTISLDGSNINIKTTGSTIIFNGHLANNGYIYLGTRTFNNVVINLVGTNETMNIYGSPTLNLLDIRSANTNAHTVNFQAGSTTTLTNLNVSSFSSNHIKLYSGTSGTKYNLSKSSGTVNAQYVDIKDSNATGGATWNAIDSTDSGNNTGWNFSTTPSTTPLLKQNGRFIKANGKYLKL